MRATTVLSQLLGLKYVRVNGFEFEEECLVLDVVPTTRIARCSGCSCRVREIRDHHRGRRWRHLDFGGMEVWLRYDLRRVSCSRCGVRVEFVPWAEHDSGFTRPFEEQAAFLAQRTDKTSVTRLLRIAWRTVGRIIERVMARLGPKDRLDGLTHIGVDELSYRKHHSYITVVVDHATGNVVWAQPGKTAETLNSFFAQLGPERAAAIKAVTMDMSQAYKTAVRESVPGATIIFDRFHVQRLAHDALDEVRRAQVRELKDTPEGAALKRTRWALQKSPWNLTLAEEGKLAGVQRTNLPLYRAYLLKETLADILDLTDPSLARGCLLDWIAWANRSRLAPFRKAAATIRDHLDGILAYVRTGLSNGPGEGRNGTVRAITKRSFGFHGPSALIALIFLCCSGLRLAPYRVRPSVHA